MNGVCNLYPIVNGKKSKLYEDLTQLTNGDKKLTNLLYGISLQEEIKSQFSHSDFNSQGEIKTDVFIKKIGLEKIMSDKGKIRYELKKIGAIDSRGKRIHYSDINQILQSVYDFNDNNEILKASIKYEKDGYYIDIDTINDENYNINNKLKIREAIYNSFIGLLKNAGFNTDFSDLTKTQFNIINIYYNINKIKELRGNTDKLSPLIVSMLFDLFSNNPFVVRIKNELGEDAINAISQYTEYFTHSEFVHLTDSQKNLILKFLSNVLRRFSLTIFVEDLNTIKELAINSIGNTTTLLNVNSMSLKDTLKDLYSKFHLDQDNLNALLKKVNKVSDAANKLMQIKLNRYETLRIKGRNNSREKGFLIRMLRQLDSLQFTMSIADMLRDLTNEIIDIQERIRNRDRDFENNKDSLKYINSYSSFVLEQIELVNAYKDVLNEILNIDLLDQDDIYSNSQLVKEIKQVASELSNVLNRNEILAKRKQVELVKSFLRIYWGEDSIEMQKLRGSTTTLDDIIELANRDINFFDRFIYATNTSNNEMMNLIAEAVKQAANRRDKKLRQELLEIRDITDKLYKSGSDTSFMFEKDENGYPKRIISDYDWDRYYEEYKAEEERLKANKDLSKDDIKTRLILWEDQHKESLSFKYTDEEGNPKILKLSVPKFKTALSVELRLTPILYEYYKYMMNKKALKLALIEIANNNQLFDVIEVANNLTTAIGETGGDVTKIWEVVKNKIVDLLRVREDDVNYGSVLEANGLVTTHLNSKGEPIDTLPLFYTNKIKDRSRVSTDFSRSMAVYLASAEQYIEMNKMLDILMLTKDYMMNKLAIPIEEGGKKLVQFTKLGKKVYANVATKAGIATDLGGLSLDFFERIVFSKSRKKGRTVSIYGKQVSLDKAVDTLVGYTSISGLSLNTLGATANLLVGKLQMLIESGTGMGGEFFNMKDMGYAEAKYFQLLGPLLNEAMSNNKSSLLGVMMERFDVLDDFYERIRETGFYKTPLSKIIGNTNLFFLYGIGEHLLHALGMLAVLHNIKVKNKETGEIKNLVDILDTEKVGDKNSSLKIKDGYIFDFSEDKKMGVIKTRLNGTDVNEESLEKVKKVISYVNKSLHGAFGYSDKGMLHRYAVGRLVMNFRQWMPAHYSRRFRGNHYDTDLEEYREGYYVSTFRFLRDCVTDLKNGKLQIAARYSQLSPMEMYNLKRTIAEVGILVMLSGMLVLAGEPKDHKGNWARRLLIYELKRMLMETMASTPFSGWSFIENILKLLNSPFASLNTIEKLSNIVRLTDLTLTIESGKHKGENRYVYNLEKSLPFYGHIARLLELGESDDLFKLFEDWF